MARTPIPCTTIHIHEHDSEMEFASMDCVAKKDTNDCHVEDKSSEKRERVRIRGLENLEQWIGGIKT